MNKPSTIDEYMDWARSTLTVDFDEAKSKNLYEVNLRAAYNIVSKHTFLVELGTKLEQWGNEYKSKTDSELLMETAGLDLLIKPYESAIDKSFRTNVLWNKVFPDSPEKGWVTPDNLFKYFNDGIRGTLVCKFIDGPSFLTDKLVEFANELKLQNRWYSQEKDEGYYAYHFYTTFDVDFYDKNLNKEKSQLEVEVQVTTQLQDVLRDLTHNFYEQKRIQPEADSPKWKWEYMTNRFRASYLSHTLHLLEAIIVQSRNDNVQSGATTEEAKKE